MPYFSIIVPVYNVEKYLDECVRSVLSQAFSDYECVLIDDGSPDNCPAMCDEYGEKYEKIKVIHKENGGLSDARNAGILRASGEYVVLLDSDDKFADDNALQDLFDVIQKYRTDVVVNVNLLMFTDDGNVLFKNGYDKNISVAVPKEIYGEFCRTHPRTIFAGWIFVLKREHLINNNLFFKKGILHEDEHWMPRVLFTTREIAVNHSPFYAYRTREGSIMAKVSPKRLFDQLTIADDMFELSKDEETYTEDGCHVMKSRAAIFCEHVFTLSSEIKLQDKIAYRRICKRLSQSIKKISKAYPMKKDLIIAAFFGVDNAKLRIKLSAKIKGVKKCLKSL